MIGLPVLALLVWRISVLLMLFVAVMQQVAPRPATQIGVVALLILVVGFAGAYLHMLGTTPPEDTPPCH